MRLTMRTTRIPVEMTTAALALRYGIPLIQALNMTLPELALAIGRARAS